MTDNATAWTSENSLPDLVSGLYYRYALFVASHPWKFIILALSSFILLSTPLFYLPLPGYLPQNFRTPVQNYSVPLLADEAGIQLSPSSTPTPSWYQGPPRAYIQQVIVKSVIYPWENYLTVANSLRGPLSVVFHLSEIIGNFKLKNNHSVNLGSECLLVEDVVRKISSAGPTLPHFNCLILSPADLWSRDIESFKQDQNVLLTIKSLQSKHEEDTSIADILFGLSSKDVGISKNGQSLIISYAVTIALKQYNEDFISGLEAELRNRFPTHQPVKQLCETITHVFFPSRLSRVELLFFIFYSIILCSIYFSVRKMDGVCSKVGVSVGILVVLVASLFMAISLSAHFGLRPSHSKGKFFYPPFSALLGFENTMALLRSILSTPSHLDVKIRVAQGLAKEGWLIIKYLLSMIAVATISFFLFIPIVQELCIYGSLILMCDFYLQLTFITAIICVDINRSDEMEENRATTHVNPLFRSHPPPSQTEPRLKERKETHIPNLHKRSTRANRGEDRLASPPVKPLPPAIIPRRLKLTFFVARKRMFQKMIIGAFFSYLFWIIYSSGFITHFTEPETNLRAKDLASVIFLLTKNRSKIDTPSTKSSISSSDSNNFVSPTESKFQSGLFTNKKQDYNFGNESFSHLKHTFHSFAQRLPVSHWPVLFSYYNISLRRHYLSILPPILISIPIPPDKAKQVTNPNDPNTKKWTPKYPSTAFENFDPTEDRIFIPTSPVQLFLTTVGVMIAFSVIIYGTVALYRCICSKNYAEWRSASCSKDIVKEEMDQVIGEAVPLVLKGHRHDVECISSDGSVVVSSCLAGVICAWNPVTGECLVNIDRKRYSKKVMERAAFSPDDSPNGSYENYCDQTLSPTSSISLLSSRSRSYEFSHESSFENSHASQRHLLHGSELNHTNCTPKNVSPVSGNSSHENLNYRNSPPRNLNFKHGNVPPTSLNFDQSPKNFIFAKNSANFRISHENKFNDTNLQEPAERNPMTSLFPHSRIGNGIENNSQFSLDTSMHYTENKNAAQNLLQNSSSKQLGLCNSVEGAEYDIQKCENSMQLVSKNKLYAQNFCNKNQTISLDLSKKAKSSISENVESDFSFKSTKPAKTSNLKFSISSDDFESTESAFSQEPSQTNQYLDLNSPVSWRGFKNSTNLALSSSPYRNKPLKHARNLSAGNVAYFSNTTYNRSFSDSLKRSMQFGDNFNSNYLGVSSTSNKENFHTSNILNNSNVPNRNDPSFLPKKFESSRIYLASNKSLPNYPNIGNFNQEKIPMSYVKFNKCSRTSSPLSHFSPRLSSNYFSQRDVISSFVFSPIWCIEFADGLVYVGTGSGALEIWHVSEAELKVYYNEVNSGITSIKVCGSRIVLARLSGAVEVLLLEGKPAGEGWAINIDLPVKISRQSIVKAHQQPICIIACHQDRIITCSNDHTLKVLDLVDGSVLFTLHGHCGPITSLALGEPLGGEDSNSVGITVDFGGVGPVIASGSQDGGLCVWDFLSGTCVYSVQAHDGAICSLNCTSSYILSLGADDRLCVWERIQGHLLNTLVMTQMYCNNMVMLTNRLLITSQQGSLTVWDITAGSPVRVVRLGDRDRTVFVRNLLPVSGSVVCDYGNQLRVIKLLVAEKSE